MSLRKGNLEPVSWQINSSGVVLRCGLFLQLILGRVEIQKNGQVSAILVSSKYVSSQKLSHYLPATGFSPSINFHFFSHKVSQM